jgi:hypothetical protein
MSLAWSTSSHLTLVRTEFELDCVAFEKTGTAMNYTLRILQTQTTNNHKYTITIFRGQAGLEKLELPCIS